MLRRLLVASFAVVVVAGCGSGGPTASPAASAPASAAAATAKPAAAATEAPSAVVDSVPPSTTMSTACAAVGIRKLPSAKGALIVRLAVGTAVQVVEVVPGDSYKAGKCGIDGDTWLKIDQVGGKGVKALYGVPFAYAAAGFFK